MLFHSRKLQGVALFASLAIVLAACSSDSDGSGDSASADGACTPAETPVINFAAYSTPREAYGKIIPAFVSQWKEEHNDQNVIFQESYAGSTTQAANVDRRLRSRRRGALARPRRGRRSSTPASPLHAWTTRPTSGMVSTSVVVFDVRPGNPNGYRGLGRPRRRRHRGPDARPRLERWRALEPRVPVGLGPARLRRRGQGRQGRRHHADAGRARQRDVFDKSARDSIQNFEAGNGDVAITYENEVLTAQDAGLDDEAVYPPSTVLIENPVAIVDKNVDEHCVRDVAEAFVAYLHTPEAKELYTDVGFLRSTDIKEAKKGGGQFPAIEDLFTVDEIGGWDALNEELFSDNGIATQAIAAG